MNCNTIIPLLSRYITGELSPFDSEAVKSHLASCPSCRIEYQIQMAIEDSLRKVQNVVMPLYLEKRILSTLPVQAHQHTSPFLIAAAACIMAILMGVWWMILPIDVWQTLMDTFSLIDAAYWAWAAENGATQQAWLQYLPGTPLLVSMLILGIIAVLLHFDQDAALPAKSRLKRY